VVFELGIRTKEKDSNAQDACTDREDATAGIKMLDKKSIPRCFAGKPAGMKMFDEES
jgi:hypothetical protein